MRARDHDSHDGASEMALGAGFELPPGATFEPDPQVGLSPSPHENKHAP
jgi:putative (di)nucleoside polyphosphate hydrolase